MAQIEGKYETIYILDPTMGEDNLAANVAKFKALVETNGTLSACEEWGKRRLAYPINDLPEGYYTLMTFTSKPDFPAELDRIYKITEGVITRSEEPMLSLRKKRSWRREGQVINQANNQATCLLSVRSLSHIIGRGNSQ